MQSSPERGVAFFSQERVIEAVARSEGPKYRARKMQPYGTEMFLVGLECSDKFYKRNLNLGPFGEAVCPANASHPKDYVRLFLPLLQKIDIAGFTWNVRFDHEDLAIELKKNSLDCQEDSTQVIFLDGPFEAVFSRFSATIRNQVRQAERKCVTVRSTRDLAALDQYYSIYEQMIASRGKWNLKYKKNLWKELLSFEDDVTFLVAEIGNKIIAGAYLVRDGNCMYYWHCAMDYGFRQYFPYCAIIAAGVRMACQEQMESFNLGASMGNESLEQFKSSWGTVKVPWWRLTWRNPVWAAASRARGLAKWFPRNYGLTISA